MKESDILGIIDDAAPPRPPDRACPIPFPETF